MRIQITTTLFFLALGAGTAFGQGAGAAAGAATLGNQVSLSGRNAQAGSVTATQSAIAGTNASVNTVNPGLQVSGPFAGSVSGAAKPFSGKLSLKEAIDRALEFNLGTRNLTFAVQQAEGQAKVVRSALLPNINGSVTETSTEVNLAAQGFHLALPIPGFTFPTIVGPFQAIDVRARLTQNLIDFAARNNYRSAIEALHANEFVAQDAKDLVVLAAGGAYLQAVTAKARIDAEKAQLETAQALYDQVAQQRAAGIAAQIDVNRSQVQVLTHRQRVTSLENDFAKLKINLARLTGLPPNDHFELTDSIAFAEAPALTEEDAVRQGLTQRADIKAAEAQIRAAERAAAAVRMSNRPSLAVSGDFGTIGQYLWNSHNTYSVSASLRIPIWQGGRHSGDEEQANAALGQRKAELEDVKGRVESEIRNAWLDLQAATSQIEVAKRNLDVAKETLDLSRQRLDAGITDSTEISQSQSAIAAAELDLINSIFAHNLAKLNLARAQGNTADNLPKFLKVQ